VAQEWGFKSLPCNTTRGLVRYMDTHGIERAYCYHHRHYVRTRWPEGYVSEIADDGLGQAKANEWVQDHGGFVLVADEAP